MEDKETARALYTLGFERFDARDYHGALEAFAGADRIMGVPTTGVELARTQAKLGLLLEARDRALAVTRYPASADEPEPFGRARQDAAELAEELARRIPSVQLEVLGTEGALTQSSQVTITVDGTPLASAQRLVPRRLNPGPHSVEVKAPGYQTFRGAVSLAEGEQRVLQISLVAQASGAEADEPAVVEPPPTDGAAIGGYVALALGGAALAGGAITGGITLSQASDIKDACGDELCPESERDALSSARTLGHTSTVCFVAGAVGLGLGIGLLAWSASNDGEAEHEDGTQAGASARPRGRRAEIRVRLTPGFLSVGGAF